METAAIPDDLKPLSVFRHRIPSRVPGRFLHKGVLPRWVMDGIRAPDGTRIRLRAVRVGPGWYTRDEWFAEFVSVLTAAHLPADAAVGVQSPAEKVRAAEEAGKQLELMGR